MKLQNLSLEQLKEIVNGAPEGAEYFEDDTGRYLKEKNARSDYSQSKTTLLVVWCSNGWTDLSLSYSELRLSTLIKLSDIRARIAELEPFKVGDQVVYLSHIAPGIISIFEVAELTDAEKCYGISADDNCYLYYKDIRHATPAEIKAGHRIDSVSAEMASPCPASDSAINPAKLDLQGNKTDSITERLNPAKCGKVNPALPYDELCSPAPMTQAELKAPVVASQQQIGGNHYTRLAIQPMHYSLANKLNAAQHTIIKYVTRYADKGGIEDLLKARHTIDLLIEHLEGEQGE